MSRSGEVIPRARNCTIASPSTAASSTRHSSVEPRAARRATSTATVPTTVATITTPSLTLIERRRSSGRTRLMPPARSRRRGPCARARAPSLRAQPAHVRVDGPLARAVAPAPDVGEQLLARVDDAGARGEQRQQVELGRGQVHRLAADLHPAGRGVELEHADPQRVAGGRGPPLDPPQQRAHARHQLARRERLGHVVVGADAEPDEHVGLLAARGQHQHRHRPVALHALADLEAVDAGEHHVEHHQVGPHALAQRPRRRARRGRPRRRSPRPAGGRPRRPRSSPRPRPRR